LSRPNEPVLAGRAGPVGVPVDHSHHISGGWAGREHGLRGRGSTQLPISWPLRALVKPPHPLSCSRVATGDHEAVSE
jgi:hypothetical protein